MVVITTISACLLKRCIKRNHNENGDYENEPEDTTHDPRSKLFMQRSVTKRTIFKLPTRTREIIAPHARTLGYNKLNFLELVYLDLPQQVHYLV